jgi:hypothetical protein
MTSNNALAGVTNGQHGLFIQHMVAGTAPASALTTCISANLETYQLGASYTQNQAAAGAFQFNNYGGSNVGGMAVWARAFHVGSAGGNQTWGVAVDMAKASATAGSYTVGVHVRTAYTYPYVLTNDYGLLLSSFPTGGTFGTCIAVGSVAYGPVACNVCIDLGYAKPQVAAIIIPVAAPVAFANGSGAFSNIVSDTNANINVYVNGTIRGQFTNAGSGGMQVFGGLAVNGNLLCNIAQPNQLVTGAVTCSAINLTTGTATTGTLAGYFLMGVNGSQRKVAYYT